ncbi:hypothetical protein N8737_02485 [Verrucomicrobia bacterium]|nr:hypothetical protein [Verrucomicrobiota bacterium]MDB4746212.1 hypothetical protein [Verrucomicrobiota bacterium]
MIQEIEMIQGLSNSVRSVRPVLLALICVVGCAISSGCATRVVDGDSVTLDSSEKIRLLMPPFFNATNDDHAGRALSELTGSALVDRGIPLYQTEELLLSTQEETAAGPDGRYQELANTVGATHLLIGTVHEYRYKTDLDGDPAVGITIRIVDARDGRTVWQGSSSNIGYAFASVTSASQRAVRRLVRRIPILEEQFESVSEPIEKSKVESDETTSVEEADSSQEVDSSQEK